MNWQFSVEVVGWVLILSLIFRVLAAALLILRVIPLMYKELKDDLEDKTDSLRTLKWQLLISTITLLLINTMGFILLFLRPTANAQMLNLYTNALSILNSFGFLVMAWIKDRIYHQHYIPHHYNPPKRLKRKKR